MPHLFDPLPLGGVTFPNRVFVSPMCQYSAVDGIATDWHLVHIGSRAAGGAGLVIMEATAVSPEGRITAQDLGLWSDAQVPALNRITAFVHGETPSRVGIQLSHAGRKAATHRPWDGGHPLSEREGAWSISAPSTVPFSPASQTPRAMTVDDIADTVEAFARAAARADAAGFDVIELHAAHGYLLHQFLSPLANQRTDLYGASFEGRTRLLREVVRRVKAAVSPQRLVFVRISATDWVEGGWDLPQSVALAGDLRALGVDLLDVSTGGLIPGVRIPVAPGYQAPFAAAIRRDANVATGTVGLITDAFQAEAIVSTEQADAVLLARELLRNPYWPLQAAHALGQSVAWPTQYLRAAPPRPA